MKCPICNTDLSPLDLVSRTEHVDLCIENGPSIVDIGETGQPVVKRNVPPGKQRKICPICDKTFQTIHSHFKTCALKNDLPPNLMLDYWDKINSGVKNPKKFPRDLLDNFVTKCIKEGRVGDQVDFARALSMSMAEDEPGWQGHGETEIKTYVGADDSNSASDELCQPTVANVSQVLVQNTATVGVASRPRKATTSKPKFRLELVDDMTKRANIELRIDRELAATRSKRYQEALEAYRETDKDDCILIEDSEFCQEKQDLRRPDEPGDIREQIELDKLFYKARLKACTGAESCMRGECQNHELALVVEGFEMFIGKSIDAPPKRVDDAEVMSKTPSDNNVGYDTSDKEPSAGTSK